MDNYGQCAVSLISAPSSVNTCSKGGVSFSEGEEAVDTVVVCASEECKFACRLHKTCLEQWKTCAEAQMQGLADAATTINSAALPTGFSGDRSGNFRQFSDAFTALKSLLDCPKCGLSRLRLARMTDKGNLQAKPFNSLLDEAVIMFSLLSQSSVSTAVAPGAGEQTTSSSSPHQSTAAADEVHNLATQFADLMTHASDGGGGVCEPRSLPLLTLPADHHPYHHQHAAKTTTVSPQKQGRRLRGSNQAALSRHNSSTSAVAALEENQHAATSRAGPHRFSDTTAPPSGLLLPGGSGGVGLQYPLGGRFGDTVGRGGGGVPAFPCDASGARQAKRGDFFKQQKQKQRFAAVGRQVCATMTSGNTSGIASGLSSSSVSFRSQGIPSLSSLDSLGQEGDCNLLGSVEDNLTPDSLSADWYFWATMSKDKCTVGADCPNNTQYPPSDVLASTGFSHALSLRNPDVAEAKTEKATFKPSVNYNCSGSLSTTNNDFLPRSGSVSQNYGSQCEHSSSARATNNQPPNQVMRSYSINLASLHSAKKPNSKGNIFRQRKDFSAFQALHPSKKNGYFIQLEDDSCTGNEDTRSFLLCQLTNHGASELYCLACGLAMPVYDHFPVVDGALFLSPICHQPQQQGAGVARSGGAGAGLQVVWTSPPNSAFGSGGPSGAGGPASGNCTTSPQAGQVVSSLAPPPGCTGPRQQQSQTFFGSGYRHRQGQPVCQERYLHAICMSCMRCTHSLPNSPLAPSPTGSTSAPTWSTTPPSPPLAPQIICRFCATPWDGSTLLIGGLYTYDLFASSPCCPDHLKCKSCGRMALSSHKTTRAESFAGSMQSGSGGGSCSRTVDEKPRRMSEGAQEEPSSLSPLLPLPFFSQYSNRICCQHCRSIDYHFIKPFSEAYTVIFPHSNASR